MAVDFKKLDILDRVVVITAAITLVALFLPWWGWSFGGAGFSASGFHTGFTGWAGSLLIIFAGVYLLLLRSGTTMYKSRFGPGVTVLGTSAVGTLLVVIRWATIPSGGTGYSGYGPRIGLYFALIAGIVQVLISFKLFRATGEKMPWDEKKAGA